MNSKIFLVYNFKMQLKTKFQNKKNTLIYKRLRCFFILSYSNKEYLFATTKKKSKLNNILNKTIRLNAVKIFSKLNYAPLAQLENKFCKFVASSFSLALQASALKLVLMSVRLQNERSGVRIP